MKPLVLPSITLTPDYIRPARQLTEIAESATESGFLLRLQKCKALTPRISYNLVAKCKNNLKS